MMTPATPPTICPVCHTQIHLERGQKPSYCPYCGTDLNATQVLGSGSSSKSTIGLPSVTLVKGHAPESEPIAFSIGSYQVIRSIGKGGMGEVFLAYDTTCGRRIALKKIRDDLIQHPQMHNRFLKEARVTSQLTHPSIIPIYSIHSEKEAIYYTMPFVEGETLKQLIRKARQEEKQGVKGIGTIPSLIRIFLSVCQAVAYAHSKGVLHRDLKPENIIIGKYGEVMILDWGLAKILAVPQILVGAMQPESSSHPLHGLTKLGKVVGTIAYMPPERAFGAPATASNDIYSLGVILYQILTLRAPFRRGTLKEFRATAKDETIADPVEVAPYRDIPRLLARAAMKCLEKQAEDRYAHIEELIQELESYIEGRSEWFTAAELEIERKEDWEFQENIFIAEHTAITRNQEQSNWVQLMISRESFGESVRIETEVFLEATNSGIGFLLSVPEAAERRQLNDGYCVWLATDVSTRLLRSTLEVLHAPEVKLPTGEWVKIRVERINHHLSVFINDVLQITYAGHLPVVGTHMGLLTRDADFTMKPLHVSVASQNVMVNCLAVPDAFLAQEDYPIALAEYRRIGRAFPGRAEGREAMFKSGITLLQKARTTHDAALFDQALEEFNALHETAGAPFEYLGKSLVYQELGDLEEENKCFELAFRRYPNHPLLPVLHEQILYRLHACSTEDRKGTYAFLLLICRYVPALLTTPALTRLIESLRNHWETLPFLDQTSETLPVALAFWLGKRYVLNEMSQELTPGPLLQAVHIAQVELSVHQGMSPYAPFSVDRALDADQLPNARQLIELVEEGTSKQERVIWIDLQGHDWKAASAKLHQFSDKALHQDDSLLFFLYGCFLAATEGEELAHIHFNGALEMSTPRSWALASLWLSGKLPSHWTDKSFRWEQRQLYRQLALYYECLGHRADAIRYRSLAQHLLET